MMRFMILISFVNYSYCNWFSDWMSPIHKEINSMKQIKNKEISQVFASNDEFYDFPLDKQITEEELKEKIKTMLVNAKQLAQDIQDEVTATADREKALKEAITNGRQGISTVKVSIENKLPRWYIIRDGLWNFCNGFLQQPTPENRRYLFADNSDAPRCVGQEVLTRKDNCAFNSIIKYEVIPSYREVEYEEDNYLCVKYTFNNTMEQYLSVPKKVVNATCQNGIVRTFEDNIKECGVRSLTEYTFYPQKFASKKSLPLEYCAKNGLCKLLVGWNTKNGSIDNYEFLRDNLHFKKHFLSHSEASREMDM